MIGDQVQIITSASRANIKIFALGLEKFNLGLPPSVFEFSDPAGKNFYNALLISIVGWLDRIVKAFYYWIADCSLDLRLSKPNRKILMDSFEPFE